MGQWPILHAEHGFTCSGWNTGFGKWLGDDFCSIFWGCMVTCRCFKWFFQNWCSIKLLALVGNSRCQCVSWNPNTKNMSNKTVTCQKYAHEMPNFFCKKCTFWACICCACAVLLLTKGAQKGIYFFIIISQIHSEYAKDHIAQSNSNEIYWKFLGLLVKFTNIFWHVWNFADTYWHFYLTKLIAMGLLSSSWEMKLCCRSGDHWG